MQQEQKILLPSPKFEIKTQSKPSISLPNIAATQTKCLASHKLFIPENQPAERKKPFFQFKHNGTPNIKRQQKHHENETKNPWCDICDKGFDTVNEFFKHKREHKKCDINGCKFYAHPSVVAKHVEEQHTTGLYDQIRKLSTPEEIVKWREERRKRYPTRANIELRQKAQEERMKRGEKLTDPKSRFGRKQERRPVRKNNNESQNDKKRIRNKFRKGNRFNTNRVKNTEDEKNKQKTKIEKDESELKIKDKEINVTTTENSNKDEISEQDEMDIYGIPRFKGTRQLDDYERPNEDNKTQNALANLLAMYGSDESENEDEVAESNTLTNFTKEESQDENSKKNTENVTSSNSKGNQSPSNEKHEQQPSLEDKTNLENVNDETKKAFVNSHPLTDSEDDMPEEAPIIRVKEEIEDNLKTSTLSTEVSASSSRDKRGPNKKQMKRKTHRLFGIKTQST